MEVWPEKGCDSMQVIDPVCGMSIDSTEAAATKDVRGRTYYFCSEYCRSRFQVKNVGMIERVLRVGLGGILVIWALVLLVVGQDPLIWRLLNVALVALGVDFVVTGIRGYCPLYNWLGWSTARNVPLS